MIKRNWVLHYFCAILLAAPIAARGEEPLHIPNFYYDPASSSLENLVLGRNCFSLAGGPMGLSCNPAFLASEEKSQLRINMNFDDGAKKVIDYTDRIHAGDEYGLINKVANQRRPIVGRAAGDIWYQNDWWSIKWTPLRAAAALRSRNPAEPEISTHLLRESEWMGQAGFFLAEDVNVQVGFQLRYVQREFLRQRFITTDAMSNPKILEISDGKAVYFEPGISWGFENAWNPRLSAMVSNVEAWRAGDLANDKTVVDVGLSTTPEFWSNKVSSSVHYTSRSDIDRVVDRFSLGANVIFSERFSVQMGIGALTQAIGAMGRLDSLVVGLGYKMEDVAPESWKTDRMKQVLFEFGLAF